MQFGIQALGRCFPEGSQVEIPRPLEMPVERCEIEDAGNAVGPHAALDLAGEIPGAALEHDAERLDAPLLLRLPALVADPDRTLPPDRIGDRRQMRRLLGLAEPGGGIEME